MSHDALMLAAVEAAYVAADEKRRREENIGNVDKAEVVARIVAESATFGGRTHRVPTGLPPLDKFLRGGFMSHELTIVAGRPGSGKSLFAMQVAEHLSVDLGLATLVFSLEMSAQELVARMASSRCGVSLDSEHATKAQQAQLMKALHECSESPMFIDGSKTIDITSMTKRSREQHAKTPLSLIVLDQIQLAKARDGKRMDHEKISDITWGCKLLARELEVPIVALSQVNRSTEKTAGMRPNMSDLSGSGSIESDADRVIFIHRPKVALREKCPENEVDRAEFIIAKNRSGSSHETVYAQFTQVGGGYPRFRGVDR